MSFVHSQDTSECKNTLCTTFHTNMVARYGHAAGLFSIHVELDVRT